jgi:hypothetical protein
VSLAGVLAVVTTTTYTTRHADAGGDERKEVK